MPKAKPDAARLIERVRRICTALPACTERLSHGEPTFFAGKKVFAMISNNHHNDGHIAVWVPAKAGMQELLIEEAPAIFYRPPYVGCKGWVGVELANIGEDQLGAMLREAWRLMAPSKLTHGSPARPAGD